MFHSYKTAFMGLTVSLLLITVGSVVFNSYLNTRSAVLDLSSNIIGEIAEKVRDRVYSLTDDVAGFLEINSTLLRGHPQLPIADDALLQVMWKQVHRLPHLVSIYAADSRGQFMQSRLLPRPATRVIERTAQGVSETWVYRNPDYSRVALVQGDGAFDPRTRPWYQAVSHLAAPRLHWSDVYLFSSTGEPGLTAAYPVLQDGRLNAVVAADISLKNLADFLASQKISKTGVALIVNQQDEMVAYSHDLKLLTHAHKTTGDTTRAEAAKVGLPKIDDLADTWIVSAYRAQQTKPESSPDNLTSEYAGERFVSLSLALEGAVQSLGWKLFIVVSETELLNSANQVLRDSFVISVIISIIAVTAIYFLVLQFSGPISRMARNSQYLREFRLSEVAAVNSRYQEIQQMDSAVRDFKQNLEILKYFVPHELFQAALRADRQLTLETRLAQVSYLVAGAHGFVIQDQRQGELLVQALNERMEAYSHIVQHQHGLVNVLMNDKLFACWGVPVALEDHALRACRTALQCLEDGKTLRSSPSAALLNDMHHRFGIHSDLVLAGILGSTSQQRYGCVGAAVDGALSLAQRCEQYGVSIVISQATYEQVADHLVCRILDVIRMTPDQPAMCIYEVVSDLETPLSPRRVDFIQRYTEGFEWYRHQQWERATVLFDELACTYEQDPSVRMMQERCHQRLMVDGLLSTQ